MAACQQLGGHASRARAQFEPVTFLRQRSAMQPQMMQRLGDLRSRAADGAGRRLLDKLRSTGKKAPAHPGTLRPRIKPFMAEETEQGRRIGNLRLRVAPRFARTGKKLQHPSSKVRGQGAVVAMGRPRMKRTDEDRLRIHPGKLRHQSLRGLFHETPAYSGGGRPTRDAREGSTRSAAWLRASARHRRMAASPGNSPDRASCSRSRPSA